MLPFAIVVADGGFARKESLRQRVGGDSHSPIVGQHLTHVGSTSYEHDSRSPNENFARELMQFFMLGTENGNVDGSFALVNGSAVSGYGMQDILNLARVFTGFRHRGVRRKHGDAVDKLV